MYNQPDLSRPTVPTLRTEKAEAPRAPARIGYARVSTDEQDVALQVDALKHAGCSFIYEDRGFSGSLFARPGLDRTLRRLRRGDTLVVWRLDRLGRSLPRLVILINRLGQKGVQFHSITEAIDTSSAGGLLVFHMMAALAEFERALISERTRAGIAAARQRGAQVGRPRALDPAQQSEALTLMQTQPLIDVARRFNVHPRTLARLRNDMA